MKGSYFLLVNLFVAVHRAKKVEKADLGGSFPMRIRLLIDKIGVDTTDKSLLQFLGYERSIRQCQESGFSDSGELVRRAAAGYSNKLHWHNPAQCIKK